MTVDLFLPLILSFFCFVCSEALLLGACTVRIVIFSSLIVVKYSSLCLVILFVLKYSSPAVNVLGLCTFFLSYFNLSVPLYLMCFF